jgi:hypothetical protein
VFGNALDGAVRDGDVPRFPNTITTRDYHTDVVESVRAITDEVSAQAQWSGRCAWQVHLLPRGPGWESWANYDKGQR